jgi:hypothetical protein
MKSSLVGSADGKTNKIPKSATASPSTSAYSWAYPLGPGTSLMTNSPGQRLISVVVNVGVDRTENDLVDATFEIDDLVLGFG